MVYSGALLVASARLIPCVRRCRFALERTARNLLQFSTGQRQAINPLHLPKYATTADVVTLMFHPGVAIHCVTAVLDRSLDVLAFLSVIRPPFAHWPTLGLGMDCVGQSMNLV